jgi:hypothetical protein
MNRRYDSDLDAAEAVAGIPEDELIARQAHLDRETRWTDFVAWLRAESLRPEYLRLPWVNIATCAVDAFRNSADPWGDGQGATYQQPYLDFAETEGWPEVFIALARAMREEEQERERLLTQG